MKKILFVLLAAFSTVCNAQNNHNYVSCEFALFRVQNELINLRQDIDIKTNTVQHQIYNGVYNKNLFSAYTETYNSYLSFFSSIKKEYEATKDFVDVLIENSNFTTAETSLLNAYFNTIETSKVSVEQSLKLLESYIKMYYKKF